MTGQSGSYDYYTCKDCGNHICVSPFSILNESEKENIAMNEKHIVQTLNMFVYRLT